MTAAPAWPARRPRRDGGRAALCPGPWREPAKRADVQGLHAVVGSEDVVHDQDLGVVQGADLDGLLGAGGQRVRPVQRAGAQRVAVKIAGAHVQQRRPELILAGLGVLLDEADVLQRPQESVDRALGQAQLAREVDDTEPTGPAGEQTQDRCRTLDGLDPSWHRGHVTVGSGTSTAGARPPHRAAAVREARPASPPPRQVIGPRGCRRCRLPGSGPGRPAW